MVQIDGWHLFCAKLNINLDQLVRMLDSYDTLKEAEQEARAMLWTPEEMAAEMGRRGAEPHGLVTAESVAATWEAALAEHAAKWS